MKFLQSIFDFINKKDTDEEQAAPEGLCPNCWGRQEYGGQVFDSIKQENLSVNSKESNVGWINAYANKHLSGIALKRSGNGEELICGKCKTSYQPKQL